MYSPGTSNTRIRRCLPVCRDLGNKTKVQYACFSVHRHLANKRKKQTFLSRRFERDIETLPIKRSKSAAETPRPGLAGVFYPWLRHVYRLGVLWTGF